MVAEDKTVQENRELKAENERLRFELSELKRLVFGQKRERFVSEAEDTQLPLFAQDPNAESESVPEQEQISYKRNKKKADKEKQKHPGRHSFPEHLERKETLLEPEEVKEGWVRIGEEVSEQLEYQAAKLFVNRFVRPKYAEKSGFDTQVHIAAPARQPLPKAAAGPGLLAAIAIDKYCDHLPLYRQGQRFLRSDVPISDSTLVQWIASLAGLLEPIYQELKSRILAYHYLQIDETTIRVQDPSKKGKTHSGYYWAINIPADNMVLFQYDKSRAARVVQELLEDWKGTVQSDGYSAYKKLCEGIESAFCWAHARRKFKEAQSNDGKRADFVLKQVQLLYEVEREAREQGLSPPKRQKLREEKAEPILNRLEIILKEYDLELLPQSLIGKAVRYTLRHWEGLTAYIKNGNLEIDNNLVENAIRPLALGRKNYLFAGSHHAAQRAAIFYSLLGTAKKQGLNPFEWLKGVLEQISLDDKPSDWDMEALLPLK